MVKKKFAVVYSRVSTEQQSEEMQLAAAQNYIKDISSDQLLKLTDHGVSALKVEMNQRPALYQLLELIRQDKVSTLITYHRDRLARNFFEYIKIIKVFYEHEVNVIFTSFNSIPFHKDLETEAIYGILSQQEGLNIAKRTRDAQALHPNAIIGYEVIKDKHSRKKTYKIDNINSIEIKQLFHSISKVKSKNEYFTLLEKYKKIIKRKNTDAVISLLQKPFYAGLKEDSGYYNKLDHAPTIIDESTFYSVQKVINTYFEEYLLEKSKEFSEKLFPPTCGICNLEMNYLKKQLGQVGMFYCSKKHKKIMIHYDELEEHLLSTTKELLENLNLKKVELVVGKMLRNKIKELSEEMYSLKNQRKNIQIKIAMNDSDTLLNKLINQLTLLDQKEEFIHTQLDKCQKVRVDMKHQIQMIRSYFNEKLTKTEKLILSRELLKQIKIQHNYIEIECFANKFVKEGELANVN